jgi:hypothetical protein
MRGLVGQCYISRVHPYRGASNVRIKNFKEQRSWLSSSGDTGAGESLRSLRRDHVEHRADQSSALSARIFVRFCLPLEDSAYGGRRVGAAQQF